MCKPGGCAHIRVSKSGGDGVVQARLPPAETLPPFLRHAWLRADGNGVLARVPLPPARRFKGVRPRRVVDATSGVSDKILVS